MKFPPEPTWGLPTRAELIDLFKLVDFHPLSIKLVAYQCKEQQVDDLARSLTQLLAAVPEGQDKDRSLVASLNLSLQRLDADLLEMLPRLGVFQGGAVEYKILNVAQFALEQWQDLKAALLRTGLVHMEVIAGITQPFVRFHPTLAPVLWRRLTTEDQGELMLRHQQEYYVLIGSSYILDDLNPEAARAIVRRELANILWAVNGALDDRSENAVEFVNFVNRFLYVFDLKRDQVFLTERLDRFIGAVGSRSWYLVLSSQGEQLYNGGQYTAAAGLFAEILQELDTEPSFDRVRTLALLGRCLLFQSQLQAAAECLGEALSLSGQLDQSDAVKHQEGGIYAVLGDVLSDLGAYSQAQQAYEDSLEIKLEISDQRGIAVVEGQLGKLARRQGDLTTAAQRYQSALETFQQFQEPTVEAVIWHQLGLVSQERQQWTAADRAYRESARIGERQGDMTGTACTYNQLAILNEKMNRLSEAEDWYRKALYCFQVVSNRPSESKTLNNLADQGKRTRFVIIAES
jgi:tetratricopeptide (TPR) repeat protein